MTRAATTGRLKVEYGSGSFAISAATFASGTAIVFGTNRFSATPSITMTQSGLPGGSQKLIPKYTGGSSGGFTPYCYTGDSTTASATFSFSWIAIQSDI